MDPNIFIKLVERKYDISAKELRSSCRRQKLVRIRTFISYYLKNECDYALAHIGKVLHRHHSSIIHLLKQHQNYVDTDDEYCEQYQMFLEAVAVGNADFNIDLEAAKILESIEKAKFTGTKIGIIKNLITDNITIK